MHVWKKVRVCFGGARVFYDWADEAGSAWKSFLLACCASTCIDEFWALLSKVGNSTCYEMSKAIVKVD